MNDNFLATSFRLVMNICGDVLSTSTFVISTSLFAKSMAGLGFLGIAGIGGLGPLVFKKDKDQVACDERDRIINHKAATVGFTAAYLVVGIACMLPFCILGPNSLISVFWLPMIFMGAGISSCFTRSVAILIQYGREVKGEKL